MSVGALGATACSRSSILTIMEWCKCVWTGTRSTGMWHKADISISTGILPTISRRRHGTTLSAETCIPVILLLRERRDWRRRHRKKAKDLLPPCRTPRKPFRMDMILRPGIFRRTLAAITGLSRQLSARDTT